MHRIVIEGDGERIFPGDIVEGNDASKLVAERVFPSLPVEPDLLKRNGVSGFVMRSFGAGWRYDPSRPDRGCAVVFYADPEFPTLHWLAQFVPNGEEPRGILRLVSDSGQLGTANVGIRSDDSVDLRTLDPKRVHVVGGSANFASSGGARFIGLGLYGAAGGFLVRWLAVSQTR